MIVPKPIGVSEYDELMHHLKLAIPSSYENDDPYTGDAAKMRYLYWLIYGQAHPDVPFCHCGNSIHYHKELGGYTRGLCYACDSVRCDAYPGACRIRVDTVTGST